MSVYDLPLTSRRLKYFANKFILSYDPVAYQCMGKRYNERVQLGDKLLLDLNSYYENQSCGNRLQSVY
jgi:hypothetical protein